MPSIPSPRAKHRPRLEIIPFIDIIFFLLATFMMASLSMIKNEGIGVHLPPAKTGQIQNRQESIAITVTQSGELFYNKDRINRDQLKSRLLQAKHEWENPVIVIHGDAHTSFENVVAVLDTARQLGLSMVSIETVSL